MKDKLIELLFEANNIVKRNHFDFNANIIADYLLKNGVIVPPCKVGDTVYVLSNGMILQTEIIRVKYEEEAENYSKFVRERVYAVLCNVEREFNFSDIGKTVFLTREDADNALKGGANNG